MFIRTERLILKPLSEVDQNAVIRILTDDTVKKTYLLPDFQTEEQAVKLFNVLKEYSTSEKHYVRGIYLNDVGVKSTLHLILVPWQLNKAMF